jgi:hypothetical protein
MTLRVGRCIRWGGVLVCLFGIMDLDAQQPPSPTEPERAVESSTQSPEDDRREGRLQQILDLADWSESRFSKFIDGEPLSVDEQLEVWRLVQRMTTFDERWLSPQQAEQVTASQLLESPARYRGRLVGIAGQARQVETLEPSAEDRDRFGIARFYRTTIDVDGVPMEVTTAQIPQGWTTLTPLNEPVEVAGVMIKVAVDSLGESRVHLAATRVAWHPTQVRPPVVNHGMSVLGILGVDIGRFDNLVQRRELTSHDAAAFYQTLEAMGRSNVEQLQRAADRHMRQQHLALWNARLAEAASEGDKRQQVLARNVLQLADEGKYSVAPFFNLPGEHVGQIASFEGVVRSALRVEVEPTVSQQHGGLDHYYQLALFTDDSQHYPLFFCVRELPSDFPVGEGLNQPVRVSGFFLKMWRFTSSRPATTEVRKRSPDDSMEAMVAPLFIGVAPQKLAPPATDRSWGYVIAAGVLLLIGGVWFIEWRRAQRDRLFAATTLARVQRANQSLDFDGFRSDEEGEGGGKLP